LSLQRQVRALNGTVLRIVNDAANGTEDGGQGGGAQEETKSYRANNLPHKRFPFSLNMSAPRLTGEKIQLAA
jgi:hypothetical protein